VLRILIYGDMNLNIIDGSSVWLTSLCRLLRLEPLCKLDLLLKCPRTEDELFNEIQDIETLDLIDPGSVEVSGISNRLRLTPTDAAKCINALHGQRHYDLVIVRGFQVSHELSATRCARITVPYITDFESRPGKMNRAEKERLLYIHDRTPCMFAQTDRATEFLSHELGIESKRLHLLYPMIPDLAGTEPTFRVANYSLAYIGKFAQPWYIENVIQALEVIRRQAPHVTLNVAGNKFHSDVERRKRWLIGQLENNPSINWVGGVSRSQAQALIEQSDIGVSWRSRSIDNDDALEVSTKLLEYGRSGKPVLLRRTRLHEDLLGPDYEAFVESEEDFVSVTLRLFEEPELYERCARRAYEAAKPYTFSARHAALRPFFSQFRPPRTRLLIAGHDLKFIQPAIKHFEDHPAIDLRIDQWKGHDMHDEDWSLQCVQWADVVFCEWGLGNAVWYSDHIRPEQKLVVRMHGQERLTQYPLQYELSGIDRIVTVSPYMYELFHHLFSLPRDKFRIVPNMVDTVPLDRPKVGEDVQFNIGIAGILPRLKRPDLAVDILEALCQSDSRYRLFVKSRKPSELDWLMNRPEERQYYEQFGIRLKSPELRDRIVFEPHGDDMAEWFQKIGYILSTSEFESFHLTPIEGMASGTVPVIMDWPGSRSVHDERFIFGGKDEAVAFILSQQSRSLIGAEQLKRQAFDKCGQDKIVHQLERLLFDADAG